MGSTRKHYFLQAQLQLQAATLLQVEVAQVRVPVLEIYSDLCALLLAVAATELVEEAAGLALDLQAVVLSPLFGLTPSPPAAATPGQ